jgi:hypothetical protein
LAPAGGTVAAPNRHAFHAVFKMDEGVEDDVAGGDDDDDNEVDWFTSSS